ncbi:MAG: hypothetical protein JO061_16335 [Acidobacteriaceae bacterium]|nr:hypothetical protein [Acidobacteriaceae bacterium]
MLLAVPALAEEPSGTVSVYVETFGMDEVTAAQVTLRNGPIFKSCAFTRLRRYVCADVPFGRYTLTVHAPGFQHANADVPVYTASRAVHVFLYLPGGDPPGVNRLTGSVQGALRSGDLWVRAMPITTGPVAMDAIVSKEGTFDMTGLDPGTYVLAVISGMKVLCAKSVESMLDTKVSITLNSHSCSLDQKYVGP